VTAADGREGAMITFVFYVVAVVLVIISRLAAGRWHAGYFIGGLLFGIYNEVSFEFCWDYDEALWPMVWRDVPLLVVVGWGILTMLVLSISNRLCAWRGITSRGVRTAVDVVVFVALGYPNELIWSSLGYWEHNFALHEMAVIWVLGYAGVGVLVSCVGRVMESHIAGADKARGEGAG
jgi:hypothetical protein